MKRTTSLFDDILKIIGATYVILIVIGFIDLKIYYSKFDVHINEYLTASEILFTSLDKLALVFVALAFQLGWFLFNFNYLFDYEKGVTNVNENLPLIGGPDSAATRLIRKPKLLLVSVISVLVSAIFAILYRLFPKSTFVLLLLDFFRLSFFIFIFFVLFIEVIRNAWLKTKSTDRFYKKTFILLPITIIALIGTIWLQNISIYPRVAKFGNSPSLELTLSDGSKISQSDTLKYLGRTEGYIFFWNNKTKQTQILPKEEVKKIIVRQ
jgi:hypothetical protein